MNRRRLVTVACLSLVLILGLIPMKRGQSQAPKSAYLLMAPLDQYLMADRNAEIALARSAAPEAISRDARILVLGRRGYETASEGKNGFVCVVERSWMSPANAPEFWNPKLRGPICFNPPAARSVLPTTLRRTEMVLAGKTKAEIIEGNKAAFKKGELPPLEPGAMSYMMSKDAYLTDGGGHNLAHLMFYTPPLDGKAWGRRSAEITGDADSTIQRPSTNRRVYRPRGQMVRRIHCPAYVGPVHVEAANSLAASGGSKRVTKGVSVGSWTKPDENRGTRWIRPVDRLQRRAYSIQRNLTSDGRREAWQQPHFAIVPHGVGLDVCKRLFLEIGRQRVFADEQFVRAAGILEPHPRVVLITEIDCRLEQVTVFLGGILKRPGSAPHGASGPVPMLERFVVHHRGGSSGLVF
jgi:hypothetical protein